MPILKREVDLHPQGLFERAEPEAIWQVAYVRSRQEKSLARFLLEREIAYYLPLRVKQVRRAGRTFVSHLPLFPGYLFFGGSHEARREAHKSNLIVCVLEVRDQVLLHEELRRLWKLQQAGVPLVSHPYLEPGDLVEITDGPFKGYRGQVLRERGRMRLVVSISLLRQSVAAEFDRELLAPVPGSRRFASAG